MTHRHPTVTVPSTCSLFSCFRKPYTEVAIDAAAVLAGMAYPTGLHLRHRAAMPADSFLDLHFRDIVGEPERVVRSVYAHCGEPLSDDALARTLDWDRCNPQNRHGAHRYSAESFGLSADQINAAFADYIAFLDRRFPEHRIAAGDAA